MTKEIYISSTPHETRLAIVEDEQLVEIHYERENEYSLAGSMYNGKVTRVLPGMQSAFVDIGLERDAFLYVTDFLEDQDDSGEFERTALPAAQRPPRTEQQGADAPAAPGDAGAEGTSAEAAPEGEDEAGSRRWKGRRSRRRGGRGREAQSSADAATGETTEAASQLTQGVTLEINSDDLEDFSFASETPRPQRSAQPQRAAKPKQAAPADHDDDEAEGEFDLNREPVSLDEPTDDWFTPDALPYNAAPVAEEQEEAPAPRGRGRRGRFGSRDTESSDDEQPSGPPTLMLPGESLSKYGAPRAESSSSAGTNAPSGVVLAKPTTLIDTPITWDGGALLPGESLSKHRGRGAREERGGRGRSQQASQTAPQAEPQPPAQHAAEPAEEFGAGEHHADEGHQQHQTFELNSPEQVHAAEAEDELTEESESLLHDEAAEQHAAAGEDSAETEVPEDASASHHFDPNPPSEFRLPWFGSKEKEADKHDPHTGTTPQDAERRRQAHELAHELASHSAPTTEVFPGVPDFVEEDEAGGDHDRNFAPGSGQVEEETMDEDEYDFEPMRAGDDEDHEDLVEETLEHGSRDVGEFIRNSYNSDQLDEEDEGGETFAADDADQDAAHGSEVEADAPAQAGVTAAGRGRRGRRGRRGGERHSQSDRNAAAQTPHAEEQEAAVEAAPAERPERSDRNSDRNTDRGGDRNADRSGDRGRNAGRRGQNGRRQSAQTQSLPAITELLKPGQEILVQIAKEPIAKKGARITSHIALPGRFLVYMPTVNHVGVSRKIASEEERQRLKRVLLSEKAEASGGFIVRTAAGAATEQELRADIRFLINLWTEIKQRSENSKSPALIYHDLSLVERILRDQVTDKFSAIWVDTEAEYERVVRFLQRFQPSMVRHVKLYSKETPLFEQFGLQEEVNRALKSKVWLKSGGSIVINQTEALVAIDVNTGKFVGKTARLEDTILKTNLDAIPEIVRQVRLRDLGGIIIIDFIDMDERRNRNKVMAALEEELKRDRAPSKVLQFNDFGLVAITRKRVKQSLERTLSMPCITCQGTGMVKNPTTVCNEIYVELRKMHKHLDRGDIMLRVHPEVVKQLKTNSSRWLQDMEEMAGRTIIIKSDAAVHPENFDIH